MDAKYDIFFSHAWADGEYPQQIVNALCAAGLRVWFDASEINDFVSITRAVADGLAKSKVLVAYYSKTYPQRRACQWELTAAFLAAQTNGDPRQRVLVVNPEATSDHIHPIELRDAKFPSMSRTDSASLQKVVQAIAHHVRQVQGPLSDILPLTTPNWYGLTPTGSTRFVGRLQQMWKVHSLLHAGDVAQITGAAAASGRIGQMSGLGGVGKSLLAEEYALRFGAAYPGGIFWIRAHGNDGSVGPDGRENVRLRQVRTIAAELGVSTKNLTNIQVHLALAGEIERRNKLCLWIVDDIPNGLTREDLSHWLAPHQLARTLITTRSREYGSLAKGLDLSVLTPEEGYQLLTSRKNPTTAAEEEQARGLALDLGYHALALDITASALVPYGGTEPFHRFRQELAKNDEDALELARELADALPNDHEKSISQTMLRSIHNLGPEGKDLLRIASNLAAAPISARLVRSIFDKADRLKPEKAEQRQRKAFYQVTSASLAEISGDSGDARTVHTLVSRTMRFHERRRGLSRLALGRIVLARRADILRRATVDALFAPFGDMTIVPHVDELFKRLSRDDILGQMAEISDDPDPRPSDILLLMHLQRYVDTGKLELYLGDEKGSLKPLFKRAIVK